MGKTRGSAASPRQPGDGMRKEKEDEDKKRFVEPLARLMMDTKGPRKEADEWTGTDEEIMNALRRTSERVVAETDIPTLY